MMMWEIITGIILILTSIFDNQLRKLKIPSRRDWILEHEDEKWAKILIALSRILLLCLGIFLLAQALFLSK